MSQRQFKQSHRRLVQDTNAGQVLPPERGRSQGLGSTPQLGTPTDLERGIPSRTEDAINFMTGLVDPSIQRAAQEESQQRMNEAMNSEDVVAVNAELKSKQNPFAKFLWGDSPEIRGTQMKIIQNESQSQRLSGFNNLEADSQNYTPETYAEKLHDDLQARLDLYDDPEIRSQMIEQHAQNAEYLMAQFVPRHEAWKQGEAAEAQLDGIRIASKLYEADPENGAAGIIQALQQQDGQTDEAWANNITNVVREDLAAGRQGVYQALVSNPELMGQLTSDQRKAIEESYGMYQMKETEVGLNAQRGLNRAIENGNPSAAAEAADTINAILPGSVNKNDMILRAEDQARRLAEQARRDAERKAKVRGGSKGKESSADLDEVLLEMGKEARDNDIQARVDAGEIDELQAEEMMAEEYTAGDLIQYAMTSPSEVVDLLEDNPKTSSNILNGYYDQVGMMLGSDSELTEEQETHLLNALNFYDTMKQRNETLTKNVTTDNNVRARLDVMSTMKDSTFDLATRRQILSEAKTNKVPMADFLSSESFDEALDAGIENLVDELDVRAFGVSWLWKTDPNNAAQIKADLTQRVEETYEDLGQNALAAAFDSFKAEAAEVNGVVLPKMDNIDNLLASRFEGGNLGDWIDDLERDPAMQKLLESHELDGILTERSTLEYVDNDRVNLVIRSNNLLERPIRQTIYVPTTQEAYSGQRDRVIEERVESVMNLGFGGL